jgi:GGDEF domain-containing protein
MLEQQNLQAALERENQTLKERVQQLEEDLARQQGAGGLASFLNRGEFIREVARMMAHDERYGGASALVVLCFEGLEVGREKISGKSYEQITQAIAGTILQQVRVCDVAGRTGPEDFSVMLTRCSVKDANMRADAIIAELQKKLGPLLQGKLAIELHYTVSRLDSYHKS